MGMDLLVVRPIIPFRHGKRNELLRFPDIGLLIKGIPVIFPGEDTQRRGQQQGEKKTVEALRHGFTSLHDE
jgi:hypothetical protein